MAQDSTGKRMRSGDRVRYRGEHYLVTVTDLTRPSDLTPMVRLIGDEGSDPFEVEEYTVDVIPPKH